MLTGEHVRRNYYSRARRQKDARKLETSKNATPRGVVKIMPAKGVKTEQGASLGELHVAIFASLLSLFPFFPPRATDTLRLPECDRSPRDSDFEGLQFNARRM